jgi:hypothetical protein
MGVASTIIFECGICPLFTGLSMADWYSIQNVLFLTITYRVEQYASMRAAQLLTSCLRHVLHRANAVITAFDRS